jgi:NAD(P)-dependent dehydrogenase (short-subunit alcohol dehydrogenase family)
MFYHVLPSPGMPVATTPVGPTTLVVGGSGGIGAAIANRVAKRASVAVGFRGNETAANDVVRRIEANGGQACTCHIDVTDLPSVAEALGGLPALDTVIWAAGPAIEQPSIAQASADDFQRVMTVEAQGCFNLIKATLPVLRRTAGNYVSVSTAGLSRHPPGDILSVAPKAAVAALSRGVAREEGRHGIRSNVVGLGVIDAGMFQRLKPSAFSEKWVDAARRNTALKRLGTAEEVASVVDFLASPDASYVTGQTLILDGGWSL